MMVSKTFVLNLAFVLNGRGGCNRIRALRGETSNVAHIRQSGPDYGLAFQMNVLKTLEGVPSWLNAMHLLRAAQIRQSGPDYGLGLSHFQYKSISNRLR